MAKLFALKVGKAIQLGQIIPTFLSVRRNLRRNLAGDPQGRHKIAWKKGIISRNNRDTSGQGGNLRSERRGIRGYRVDRGKGVIKEFFGNEGTRGI